MTAFPETAATRLVRVTDLHRMKAERQRIVMTTCYDTLFAKLLDECGVDVLLVGDSVAEVLNGEGSTLTATLDQMIYHATAVCRGVRPAVSLLPRFSPVRNRQRGTGHAGDRMRRR